MVPMTSDHRVWKPKSRIFRHEDVLASPIRIGGIVGRATDDLRIV